MLTMSSEREEEEEEYCECSDDDMYNPGHMKKGTWEPKAEDMIKIFDELNSKKVLELSWTCPGRRPPDSNVQEEEEKEEAPRTPPREEEKKPVVPTEFDFDEDFTETRAVLTPRRTPGSAPKSEKKVARMDKVLKDMMLQRKLQAAERESRKLAKSPRNTASPGRARIGSPAGSPRATVNTNRQSPVRPPAPDNFPITPLRNPMDFSDNIARNTTSETMTVNGTMSRSGDINTASMTSSFVNTLSPGQARSNTPSGSGRPGTPGGSVKQTFMGGNVVPNTLSLNTSLNSNVNTGRPNTPGSSGRPTTPGSSGRPTTPGSSGRPNTPGSGGRPNTPGTSGRPTTPGSGRSATPSNSGRSTPSSTGRLTPSRSSQVHNTGIQYARDVNQTCAFGETVSVIPSGVNLPGNVQISSHQTMPTAGLPDGQSRMDTS